MLTNKFKAGGEVEVRIGHVIVAKVNVHQRRYHSFHAGLAEHGCKEI
jgi:hypothetical protein